MWSCTSRNIGQISNILCQLLVCSGKSQLSNYANVNYLKNVDMDLVYVVSCQDYFMSWHTDIWYIVAALLEIRLKVVIWLWWVTDGLTDRRTDGMTEWQTQQFISTSLHVWLTEWQTYWQNDRVTDTTVYLHFTACVHVVLRTWKDRWNHNLDWLHNIHQCGQKIENMFRLKSVILC